MPVLGVGDVDGDREADGDGDDDGDREADGDDVGDVVREGDAVADADEATIVDGDPLGFGGARNSSEYTANAMAMSACAQNRWYVNVGTVVLVPLA